ncbi:MAG: hypothetical protein HQL50_13155 [Magnetococcales bacterium]|nr:hypothetical protein [Magnetococcales bacterium]
MASPHLLHWTTLEDAHFLFDERSGTTHILNDISRLIMERLIERPDSVMHLTHDLFGPFPLDLSQNKRVDDGKPSLGLYEALSRVRLLMSHLDQLGLVHPVGMYPTPSSSEQAATSP